MLIDTTDDIREIADELDDALTSEQKIKLLTELYLFLSTEERVEVKKNIS